MQQAGVSEYKFGYANLPSEAIKKNGCKLTFSVKCSMEN